MLLQILSAEAVDQGRMTMMKEKPNQYFVQGSQEKRYVAFCQKLPEIESELSFMVMIFMIKIIRLKTGPTRCYMSCEQTAGKLQQV